MQDLLEQLHQLVPMAAAATPGEWQQSHRKGAHAMYSTQVYDVYGATIASMAWHEKPLDDGSIGTYREDNAAFIAAARNLLTPENLLALCAALVPQWVAVTERLPEAKEGYTEFSPWVLAYTTAGRQIEASYYFKESLKGWHTPTGKADVTHWMLLPTSPAN